jgi:hypothetical protein
MDRTTNQLTTGILVEAVKFSSWLHQWTPVQVEDPEKGVSDHLERIQACNAVWHTTRLLMVLDQKTKLLQPILDRYETWTSGLASMYEYLARSPEPFPGSILTMGMRLTPSKKDLQNETVDYLKKLQVKVETLLLKSAMHEQQAELQTVRKKLLILKEAHVNSPAEREVIQAEIARMEGNLRVSRDRDEYQDRYMSNLQEFLEFVRAATKVAEDLVSGDETNS